MMVTTQSTSENLSQRNRPRSSAEAPLRALVVDDEPVARRVVIFALTHEGFVCDAAVDGLDALEKIRRSSYDLVVTDLLMPHKHGHALSVELLERRRDGTPLIVVHTSVDNPRLTKDLIMRGVDDVVYKPAQYEAFAAKMRAMVKRRRLETSRVCAAVESEAPRAGLSASPCLATPCNSLQPVHPEEFEQRLSNIHHLLPVSDVAVEVVHRVRRDDCDARSLAELIKRDAVLTTELLKMVNNGLYNPSGRKITELHEAVARVGIKRIGEISLAVSTFKGLARLALPWFDTELTHVRSLAGCLLADRLSASNTDPRVNQSVTFSALLFPLARAVVGAEFSELYEKMLELARDRQCALDEVEAEFLPVSPVKALVRLISQWNLPADLYAPLAHLEASPQELDQLPPLLAEAVRSLQRVLALVPFTVGRWMPWESVGVPPSHVLAPADPQRLVGLVEQVRGELKNQPGGPSQKVHHGTASPSHLKLFYARFGPAGHDWLRDVLNTFDFQLEDAAGAPHALPPGTVVNAVEATPEEIVPLSEQAATRNLLLFLPGGSQVPPGDPHFLVLPTSYRSLMMHCAQHASR